jgi:hypothetical protein
VVAVGSLLVVLLLILLISRIATTMLTLTGLSEESARFQARSALTLVGFTTAEAESVVNHPVRRRVVMWLMLVGAAGVTTGVTTLMLSFLNTDRSEAGGRLLLLVGGLVALLLLTRSRLAGRLLERLIARALDRWTDLEIRDYDALLRISGEYAIAELFVEPDDWLARKTLGELQLSQEGVRVLGIVRPDGSYLGVPEATTMIEPGDTLILYGPDSRVEELDRR